MALKQQIYLVNTLGNKEELACKLNPLLARRYRIDYFVTYINTIFHILISLRPLFYARRDSRRYALLCRPVKEM
jgi:hypothetical protein